MTRTRKPGVDSATSRTSKSASTNRAVWPGSIIYGGTCDTPSAACGASPSFVLTTTLTLAVAIGLLTTAFAVVNGFLRPYAIRDPGGLYQVSWRARESGSPLFRWSDYDEFRKRADLFSAVVGEDAHMVSSSGQPVLAAVVSLDYFDALGPAMRLGRGLAPIDAGANAAVLSDPAWRRIFDRDPAILDRDIELNGRMYRIVGVLGPEFSGLVDQPRDVFVPRPAGVSAGDGTPDTPPPGTMIVARLAAGVTRPQAEGALAGFMRARFDREQDVAAVVEPHPGPNELTLQVIAILTPVFVPFVLVLVTACANVSNVMLARAIRRQREIAVRLSIGASRARVVTQLLTEGACLAAIAGAAGLALSAWGLRLVPELLVNTLPASLGADPPVAPARLRRPGVRVRGRASTMATMLFALAPALQASRIRPVDSLRGQRHGSPRGVRLRHTLVVAQVASALVLVVSAITLAHNGAGMSRRRPRVRPGGRDLGERPGHRRPRGAPARRRALRGSSRRRSGRDERQSAVQRVEEGRGGAWWRAASHTDRSHVRLVAVLFDAPRTDRPRARLHGRRGARRRAGGHRQRGHGDWRSGRARIRSARRSASSARRTASSAISPATRPSPSSGRFAT